MQTVSSSVPLSVLLLIPNSAYPNFQVKVIEWDENRRTKHQTTKSGGRKPRQSITNCSPDANGHLQNKKDILMSTVHPPSTSKKSFAKTALTFVGASSINWSKRGCWFCICLTNHTVTETAQWPRVS
jgi:hypothetical protein